jgi:hypothetical protein
MLEPLARPRDRLGRAPAGYPAGILATNLIEDWVAESPKGRGGRGQKVLVESTEAAHNRRLVSKGHSGPVGSTSASGERPARLKTSCEDARPAKKRLTASLQTGCEGADKCVMQLNHH